MRYLLSLSYKPSSIVDLSTCDGVKESLFAYLGINLRCSDGLAVCWVMRMQINVKLQYFKGVCGRERKPVIRLGAPRSAKCYATIGVFVLHKQTAHYFFRGMLVFLFYKMIKYFTVCLGAEAWYMHCLQPFFPESSPRCGTHLYKARNS